MGKVIVTATIENLDDVFAFEKGSIAVEDFVIDPMGQRLIGNPAHGGEHMIEIY